MDDATQDETPKSLPGADKDQPSEPSGTPAVSAIRERHGLAIALQGFVDKALHFLSHASNETLGACLVGLLASTYFLLGRAGLVIIGLAVGVVLHATWEGIRHDDRDEEIKRVEKERRREAGIEVARRVLAWRTTEVQNEEAPDSSRIYPEQQLDFSSFGPKAAEALEAFTNAIIKDYVRYWYEPAIPGEQTFPSSCKRTLTAFLLSLTGHLRRKRPADVFLDFVTNASSIIIVFLNELAAALNASPNQTAEDAVATYLALKPDSSLSYMLNQHSQSAKLADAAEDILQAYLDPKAYNCSPVHNLLKEVLAQLVLVYTVTYCSRAEFLNDWIVYGLEESATTKEVMDMVDAGVEGRTKQETSSGKLSSLDHAEKAKQERAVAEEIERGITNGDSGYHSSKGEEAMDEAMREAKRLTQLMIEEDERRAREEQEKHTSMASSEDLSDAVTSHGVPTPTSSQSEQGHHEEETTNRSVSQLELARTTSDGADQPMTPQTQQFTNFDQILPSQSTLITDSPERSRGEPAQLTLHNATVSLFDDSTPGDRSTIKAKPTADYWIQIEPATSLFPGWMIARKYADFEMLHEVLRRISVITGVQGFAQSHAELPKWRANTKPGLRAELEKYLTDAVRYQPLAESEGMKRFLEKDQGLAKTPSERKGGFGWPTPDAFGKLGGDMMNVLTNAPKQVAGSGKAVLGGVAGLVGAGKRASQSQTALSRTSTNSTLNNTMHKSTASVAHSTFTDGSEGIATPTEDSQESLRSSLQLPPEERKSDDVQKAEDIGPQSDIAFSSRVSIELQHSQQQPNTHAEEASKPPQTATSSFDDALEASLNLPPPPSEIDDDFGSPDQVGKKSIEILTGSNAAPSTHQIDLPPPTPPRPPKPATPSEQHTKSKPPLTERETSVAIELIFAVITELYTLSSAWQIRRTLLAAAKNFLLRPGNPTLLTIRDMLQKSLLDDNLSDEGLAAHIYKLRENSLPTAEELKIWERDYPEKTLEQREELRVKARKLLVTKGMPQALATVMGATASGEALGKVFDCLQVPEVARGLVFGLVLQALRIVTH